MKKIMMLAVIGIMFAMTGCTNSSEETYADGIYTAKMSSDSYGWTDTLEVTYEEGVVTSAVFESLNTEGSKKSEASADEYPMDPLPSDWIPELSTNILAAGNATDIDAVTGATLGTNNAIAMMEKIEEAALAGEASDVIIVDVPTAE
ncbi:MAG: hypothetical protein R3Y57_01740 [Erysipelotrichaceae bacterium]